MSEILGLYDLMRSESHRLKSFNSRPNSKWRLDFVRPEELANAGFFFLNNDRVQCAFCRGIVSGWESGDRPFAEHSRHFPRCPFIMEEDVGNIPIDSDPIRGPKQRIGHDVCGNMTPISMRSPILNSISVSDRNSMPLDMREYGVQPHRGPKNPNFKSIDARKRSFFNNCWEPSVPVSTDTLAEAGFFSIGMSDYVKCFYCDGGLCNWELGDDPWIEHAKWFPDCHFVQLNKSDTFIDQCRQLTESECEGQTSQNSRTNSESDPEIYSSSSSSSGNSSGSDSEDDSNIDALGMLAVNQWMNTDIVLQLIDLNAFPIDVIKNVLTKRWYEQREPFTSFAHLYDAVTQYRTEENTQNSQTVLTELQNNELNTDVNASEECPSDSGVYCEYPESEILPNSQSSISSNTSTLSNYSSLSESSPKSEDSRLLCKICLDREIGVVFLPCGHQLTCTQCAPCVSDCPICRKEIRGTVRTFFS